MAKVEDHGACDASHPQLSGVSQLLLHQSELMENDEKSVRRVIEILGGHWGRIGLERQYEEAEVALFQNLFHM